MNALALCSKTRQPAAFDPLLRELQRRIVAIPENAAALGNRLLSDAASTDNEYWSRYDELMLSALKTAPVAAKEAPADDSLDADRLTAYLRGEFPDEDQVEVVASTIASQGFSKKTMLVKLRGNKHLPGELALRIDQSFNFLGTTVFDEYAVLEHLWKHGMRVPQPFALESSGAVLGHPFIVFRKVDGAPIGSNYNYPPRSDSLVAELAQHLATLHGVPIEGVRATRGNSDVRENLDQEIEKYYRDWRALDAICPTVEAAFKWIKVHRERGDGRPALVHNDYNFNNILIHDGHVEAVVDWEFVYIGTAAADIAYFFYAAESVASFDLFLREYAAAGGQVPDSAALDFYILWGQLRLTVMNFQVTEGFKLGKFDDIRFGLAGYIYLPLSIRRIAEKLTELLAKT